MKFRPALTVGTSFALACFAACSGSSSDVADNDDDLGEEDVSGGGQGGGTGGTGGAPSGKGGNGGAPGGGGSSGGGGSVGPDGADWGPCQMILVPPNVKSTAVLRTAPTVAAKCLPAGSPMSRSLALMATSTAAKRHKVKVLFYGQSITKNGWVPETEDYLKATFPFADFEFREEAIGGFLAQKLIHTAEHDVFPWYPDLMIFHSYTAGNYLEWDALMQLVRRRTTTEIMQQTHHVTGGTNAIGGEDVQSFIEIPSVAQRLGIHVIDIRGAWRAHLVDTGTPPGNLLDGPPHLSAAGNSLYAKITNAQLKYDPNVIVDPLGMVTTHEVGKTVKWEGKTLSLKFNGNRVVFQAKAGMKHAANGATVLVDGKKPSEFVSAYAISRPNRDKDLDWPWAGSVTKVTMDPTVQPRVEKWTMELNTIDQKGECTFTLTGSITGPDGSGKCNANFTSNSKRIKIASTDYYFKEPQEPKPNGLGITIPVGHLIHWEVYALHADSYPPAPIDASNAALEYPTTIIQGIPNGEHTLELTITGDVPPAIEAIQVYRPPLR